MRFCVRLAEARPPAEEIATYRRMIHRPRRRVLIVGIGGGCDIISAYALSLLISRPKPREIVYANTKRRADEHLVPISDHVLRVSDWHPVLDSGGDVHGTTAIDHVVPRGDRECPFVFLLPDRTAEPALACEIKQLGFDQVVAVDTGGDSLVEDALSGIEGRDKRMLGVLRATGLALVHVIVAPCSDGESTADQMRQASRSAAPRYLGRLDLAEYMFRHRNPPLQTWRTFLQNHAPDIAAIDFFVVPTVRFQVRYCFIVLRHDRHRVVHFNVTAHPTAGWTAQQVVEAFPYDEAPRFLIRDRDGIYGVDLRKRITHMGVDEVVTAPRSPWQNPFAERAIGSIRRECLDHVIVLNEPHLIWILTAYFAYYHESRTHLSLDRNAPVPRRVEPPGQGRIIAIPQVGGLHHRYTRAA